MPVFRLTDKEARPGVCGDRPFPRDPATTLGAILLTGYLGGAVATHFRVGDPLFSHVLFPTCVGAMIWGRLSLRDARVRAHPVPRNERMKAMQPYLNFDGTTRDAMTFYHKALGGDLQMQTFGESKIPVPPGSENRVIHARIQNGSAILMASDSPPGMSVTFGNNYHINVDCDDKAEVDRLMKALGEGGNVKMPAQDMFWGAYFGMLTDRHGVNWMFNAEPTK